MQWSLLAWIVACVALSLFFISSAFHPKLSVRQAQQAATFTIASSTGASFGPPPLLGMATSSSPATTTKTKSIRSIASTTGKQSALVSQPEAPAPILQPPIATDAQIEAVNTTLRQSLVNILCTTSVGGAFRPISGSGVIIDTRGVILTNAHVAQFFLLRDYPTPDNIQCTVRTGSPATNRYTARLLYLPPAWIAANASQITSEHPTGSGENDYAFLQITGTTDGSPLPSSFPAVMLSLGTPALGYPIVLAAYPAQYLGGTTIQENLYVSSSASTVDALYTFSDKDGGPVDLISVGGTIVSQSGSSGGAVAQATDGALIALITTETAGATTALRDLHAITLAHIERSLVAEGQGGIVQLLSGDIAKKADDFAANTAPSLMQQLVDALKK